MMNKIILLLLANCSLVFAGEESGTGTTPSSTNSTSNENVYSLVCTPVTDQNEDTHCILVEVAIEE